MPFLNRFFSEIALHIIFEVLSKIGQTFLVPGIKKFLVPGKQNFPGTGETKFSLYQGSKNSWYQRKKSPYSDTRFLKFWTLKILILGQKTSKIALFEKMLILGRRTFQSRFFSKKFQVQKIDIKIFILGAKTYKKRHFWIDFFQKLPYKL